MISILKTHKQKVFKFVNYGYGLVFAAAGGAMLYIPTAFGFLDLETMRIDDYLFGETSFQSRLFWWVTGYASLACWVPAGFSLVLSCCSIMAGHYVECEKHRDRCLNDFRVYIGKGDALYDLQVIFLRITQTSSSWSKCVLWSLAASSICFFYMLVTYLSGEGFLYSVYPPLGIMLPALWSTAFAAGAVTSRFVRIYIAINTRSPLLLQRNGEEEEAAGVTSERGRRETNANKLLMTGGVSLSITTGIGGNISGVNSDLIKEDGEKGGGGKGKEEEEEEKGEKENGVHFSASTNIEEGNWVLSPEFGEYKDAHLLLMELCKHFEDIFGIRIFGLKITAAQLLQIATFYGTGATLILQNSGKVSLGAE